MNPACDPLYQIHQCQAARRGQSPLAYEEFRARVPTTYDTDLTGLLFPAVRMAVQVPVQREPKFSLGQICITAAAAKAVQPDERLKAFARHAAGDWGTLDAKDWAANEEALRGGGRLLSVYATADGCRFYVITESDRQSTTLLLPDDY